MTDFDFNDLREPSGEHRLIGSRSEFQDALRALFQQAAEQGCREIFISDPDFAEWPLGERAVVEQLTQWAMAHRHLTVLAGSYADLDRRHPRWVTWRRQWAHVVSCRALPEEVGVPVPCLMLASGLASLRVFDALHYRASWSALTADAVNVRQRLDVLLQQSVDAFPASVAGL